VAASLPWTTGSLFTAALDILKNHQETKEWKAACSPTSGFHHAHYDHSEGFCTFNGLAITFIKLHQLYPDFKIGILDLDHHYGNGTADIIRRRKIDYVKHYTFGGDNPDNYYWKGDIRAERWLQRLPKIAINNFEKCHLVLYQAGADPHVSDPHGGALTNEQLRERDRIVFSQLKILNVPVVWNLAGGYQKPIQKVLDIHNATIEECLKVYEKNK